MSEPTDKPLDRWADWLVRGRQRGMSEAQAGRLLDRLGRVRTQVLTNARIRAGQRVLDVGAGTGLLALEACQQAGPSGQVVALDISEDALRECRRASAGGDAAAPLNVVHGDARSLPFRDGAFDRVMTRSVLIYVADKPEAIGELYRVLKPGGRAAIFEPINSAMDRYHRTLGPGREHLQPIHERVIGRMHEGWEHHDAMLGFDERDLVRWFAEAGFSAVRLAYSFDFDGTRRLGRDEQPTYGARPNPSMMSYEEAARAVLGNDTDEYLAELTRLDRLYPRVRAMASAYITARR